MAKISLGEQEIDELKAKHGPKLHVLEALGVEVVVRAPSRVQYKAFRAKMQDDRRKLDAPEQFLRDCIVYPEAAAVDAIFEDKPGLVETFGGELLEIAGVTKESEKKAL